MKPYAKYHLLIVDDDEALREAMVFHFERLGFTVYSAESGQTGLAVVEKQRIDLVISDIRMPDGNGLDLLKGIRARDPRIPVVMFVTGFAEVTEAECIANGAVKVFTKPFDRKALSSAVIAALEAPAI